MIINFKNGKWVSQTEDGERLCPEQSWVYVWIEPRSRKALYVGETGQSKTYDLKKRLRRSIGELKHNTLGQVKRNAGLVCFDLASFLQVYAFHLKEAAKERRQGVEAWLHWLIVVKHRQHHSKYFGFSYHVPDQQYFEEGNKIYKRLAETLRWRIRPCCSEYEG